MKINKRPKSFGTWLSLMMIKYDVEDLELAKHIHVTVPTILTWKAKKHLPKLPSIFGMLDYFSIVSGDSPSEIMDDLLDSIHEYRKINVMYRERNKNES